VHQTRAYFRRKFGQLVDNQQVGKELAESYWLPGGWGVKYRCRSKQTST
jgi:hypothetical protein